MLESTPHRRGILVRAACNQQISKESTPHRRGIPEMPAMSVSAVLESTPHRRGILIETDDRDEVIKGINPA